MRELLLLVVTLNAAAGNQVELFFLISGSAENAFRDCGSTVAFWLTSDWKQSKIWIEETEVCMRGMRMRSSPREPLESRIGMVLYSRMDPP